MQENERFFMLNPGVEKGDDDEEGDDDDDTNEEGDDDCMFNWSDSDVEEGDDDVEGNDDDDFDEESESEKKEEEEVFLGQSSLSSSNGCNDTTLPMELT